MGSNKTAPQSAALARLRAWRDALPDLPDEYGAASVEFERDVLALLVVEGRDA